MSLKPYLEEIVLGHRRGIAAPLVRSIALCCSMIYIFVVQIRLLLFRRGLFKSKPLEAKVISVGNITLGGAGKTPVVAYLAGHLQKKGRKVGILSRGYKRTSKGVQAVSDGQAVRLTWQEAGDEPYLLARKLPGVPVIVGKNRISAGRHGIEWFDIDTLLLDDGFQHVKLRRDLDIVVIDASNPFGNGRTFPAGHLREPLRNLKRTNLFWLTRVDQTEDLPALQRFLNSIQSGARIIESTYQPIGLRCRKTGAEADLSILTGSKTVLLCGIANPTSFKKSVADVGAHIVDQYVFPDHHPFTVAEIRKVQQSASDHGAEFIVTTEKDGVRIPDGFDYDVPMYELITEVRLTQGEELLEKILWNETSTKSCLKMNSLNEF